MHMANVSPCGLALSIVHCMLQVRMADGCTSILVAKGAAAGGATMTSHTNDCNDCDFRLSTVKAKIHAPSSVRPLYSGRQQYPRYIGTDRGKTYFPERVDTSIYPWKEGEGDFAVMATVPEVSETYAYLDGSYGIMNEWGLAMGESTCGALLTSLPLAKGGKARIDIREMSRIALERCKTARCAVDLMGSLATTLGYFGADGTQDESGESLQLADPEEAWVFHVLADDTGASAVWAAKRVPDGHVFAIANQFTIRRLELSNYANFRFSDNIHEVAERTGLWNRSKHGYPLDFTATFALSRGIRSPYATRRVWRVFTQVAPSLAGQIPADTTTFADDYPFSVPAERLLTVADIASLFRDHYENTPFDMTVGLAAGPYGDPSRFDPGSTYGVYADEDAISSAESIAGKFERATSIYRCAHSWISQSRAHAVGLGLIWFGQYAPHASQYVPVYVQAGEVPSGFDHGTLYKYDDSSSYWVHAATGNWAARFHRFTIGDIKALQARQEGALYDAQPRLEAHVAALMAAGNHTAASSVLAKHTAEASASDVEAWREFFHEIIAKYKDGQRLDDIHEQYTIKPTLLFYPRWWLDIVGFWNVTTPQPSMLSFQAGGTLTNTAATSFSIREVVIAFLAGMVGLVFGHCHGSRHHIVAHGSRCSEGDTHGNAPLTARLLA